MPQNNSSRGIRSAYRSIRSYFEARPSLSYALLALLVSLVPFLCADFLHAMLNTGISYFRTLPRYIDGYMYYTQIKGMIAYSAPLGYFGFFGTHAAYGTFGPWGVGPLWIYALLGRIFGFTYYSMCWMNALLITLGNLAFIYLAKPSKRQMGLLALAEAVSFYLLFYLGSAMTMALRFTAALIMCGLFARLYLYDTGKLFRYLAVPVSVLLLTYSYYPFAALIPPLLLARGRSKKSLVKRAALSIPVTAACGGLAMIVNRYTTAPYYLNGDEAADFASEMLAHPLAAVQLAFRRLMNKLDVINPFSYLSASESEIPAKNSFRFFYICLLAGVLVALILRAVRLRGERSRDRAFSLYALYALSFMSLGFLLFDRYSNFSNMNYETSFALFAACCALSLSGDGKFIKSFAAVSLIGLVPFWTSLYYPSYAMSAFASDDDLAYFDTRAATYSQYISVDASADDPWENTVALCSHEYRPLLWMPAGLGYNLNYTDPRDGTVKSKYVLACADKECAKDSSGGKSRAEMYEDAGFILLYEDTDTGNALLLNPKYGEQASTGGASESLAATT